ncbi:MAG: helix-turn-helix transcriptional regulator [Clostridia bacterium]|nr:helix-turn-helix transcriptional regulator [Clostridia bacterium]
MKTRIRDLREDHDLSQTSISKMLNISQVAYSYYELEKREIPLNLLCKLADFYNTSVDYLLYRTNNINPYKK